MTVTEALARGLYDLDRHEWGGDPDWESLTPHYIRKAERFLLPRLTTTHDDCPACAIYRDLIAHRDATYADWGTSRGVLNFAAVIARRACSEYRPSEESK